MPILLDENLGWGRIFKRGVVSFSRLGGHISIFRADSEPMASMINKILQCRLSAGFVRFNPFAVEDAPAATLNFSRRKRNALAEVIRAVNRQPRVWRPHAATLAHRSRPDPVHEGDIQIRRCVGTRTDAIDSKGATLGIMGRSGSGKTTITRLLQRLHSNYDGLVKIDGIDVREYDVDHSPPQSERGAARQLPVQRNGSGRHHSRQDRRDV